MSTIVIAPFSNDDIRDWPADRYAALLDRLLDMQPRAVFRLVGTPSQRLRACEIVRRFDPARVINDCGRAPWPRVVAALRTAACVIGNNSGIAHLSALLGTPTVCVFGGSHQRRAWRPMGFNTIVLSRAIGCSPCHLHLARNCPYDLACLREITPEVVADAVETIMARVAAAQPDEARDQGMNMRQAVAK